MTIVIVVAVALILVGGGFLVRYALKLHAQAMEKLAADWAPYAAKKGLSVLPAEGLTTPMRLEGRVESVLVSIVCMTKQSTDDEGQSESEQLTILTAEAPRPVPVKASVYPTHGLSGLGQLLGMQDVEVGDPVFDPAFVVKADDVGAVRVLLRERARRGVLAFPKKARFEYARGKLTCTWKGWEIDPRVLDAAIEAAVGLCGAS